MAVVGTRILRKLGEREHVSKHLNSRFSACSYLRIDSSDLRIQPLFLNLDVLSSHASSAQQGNLVVLQVGEISLGSSTLGMQVGKLAVPSSRDFGQFVLGTGLYFSKLVVREGNTIHELLHSAVYFFLIEIRIRILAVIATVASVVDLPFLFVGRIDASTGAAEEAAKSKEQLLLVPDGFRFLCDPSLHFVEERCVDERLVRLARPPTVPDTHFSDVEAILEHIFDSLVINRLGDLLNTLDFHIVHDLCSRAVATLRLLGESVLVGPCRKALVAPLSSRIQFEQTLYERRSLQVEGLAVRAVV